MEIADKRTLYAKPLNPYTQALIAAVPVAYPAGRRGRKTRNGWPAIIPSALNPPPAANSTPAADTRWRSAGTRSPPGHSVAVTWWDASPGKCPPAPGELFRCALFSIRHISSLGSSLRVSGSTPLMGVRSSVPLFCARMALKMEDFAEITALVADRATLFRYGLIRLLQERRTGWSCAEAGTAEEVQSHLSVEPVDLVLLDLLLAGGRALTELRRLREQHPDQTIAILADSEERGAILECLAAGASGYILKSASLDQFMRAIETILSGGVFAPAALAGLQQPVAPARDPEATDLALHLTERQIEVFHLLSQGCATKTIARRLGLGGGHGEGAPRRDLSGARRAQPRGGDRQGRRRARAGSAVAGGAALVAEFSG